MKYILKCISCKIEYEERKDLYTCLKCGELLGTLEVIYDFSSLKVDRKDFTKFDNIWQFEKLLPIKQKDEKTHLHVGGTPLYSFKGLLGMKEVLVKYDGGNPTGSFKDRATSVAVAKAIGNDYKEIFCASTGNAASSLAGISASMPLKAYIFLPSKAPMAKISQLFVYGSVIIPIDGSYDDAFDISLEVGKEKGWYCRNSAINPFLLEGKKTCAFEIIVQNDWKVPDFVLVPVGDGTVISSFYKGFSDLKSTGLIEDIPKIIGIQASGSNSINKTFEKGEPFIPIEIDSHTVADSISVGKPRDVIKACRYVEKSGGYFVEVEDEDILKSGIQMATQTGVFGEPAGMICYAGLKKLIQTNKFTGNESVCLVVTGNGLKDIKAVEKFVDIRPVKPEKEKILTYIEDFEKRLNIR